MNYPFPLSLCSRCCRRAPYISVMVADDGEEEEECFLRITANPTSLSLFYRLA